MKLALLMGLMAANMIIGFYNFGLVSVTASPVVGSGQIRACDDTFPPPPPSWP